MLINNCLSYWLHIVLVKRKGRTSPSVLSEVTPRDRRIRDEPPGSWVQGVMSWLVIPPAQEFSLTGLASGSGGRRRDSPLLSTTSPISLDPLDRPMEILPGRLFLIPFTLSPRLAPSTFLLPYSRSSTLTSPAQCPHFPPSDTPPHRSQSFAPYCFLHKALSQFVMINCFEYMSVWFFLLFKIFPTGLLVL